MGLLSAFKKEPPAPLLQLPSGSFTLDRNGKLLVRTLSSSFPQEIVQQIGELVMQAFAEARAAHVPLQQLEITYPAFQITARELRGGAMVFLSPRTG